MNLKNYWYSHLLLKSKFSKPYHKTLHLSYIGRMKYFLLILAIIGIYSCSPESPPEAIKHSGPSYEVNDSMGRDELNLLHSSIGDTIIIRKDTTYPEYDMVLNVVDNTRQTTLVVTQTNGKNVGLGFQPFGIEPFKSQNAHTDSSYVNIFTSSTLGYHRIDWSVQDDFMSNKTFNLNNDINDRRVRRTYDL
mgnify:CR=1 FL=1